MELALALSLAEAGGAAPPPDADAELAAALAASLADALKINRALQTLKCAATRFGNHDSAQ